MCSGVEEYLLECISPTQARKSLSSAGTPNRKKLTAAEGIILYIRMAFFFAWFRAFLPPACLRPSSGDTLLTDPK